MITAAIVLTAALAVVVAVFAVTGNDVLKTVAISLGVTDYHFLMRLAVGFAYNSALHNRVDYTLWWFRSRSFEPKLYRVLRVKKWKKFAPTFIPEFFDMEKHSPEEILGAMCQSELVHMTIIPLSFLPITLVPLFGAAGVFWITSVLSAVMDLVFVVIQRYNRPRLIRLLQRHR